MISVNHLNFNLSQGLNGKVRLDSHVHSLNRLSNSPINSGYLGAKFPADASTRMSAILAWVPVSQSPQKQGLCFPMMKVLRGSGVAKPSVTGLGFPMMMVLRDTRLL